MPLGCHASFKIQLQSGLFQRKGQVDGLLLHGEADGDHIEVGGWPFAARGQPEGNVVLPHDKGIGFRGEEGQIGKDSGHGLRGMEQDAVRDGGQHVFVG